MSKEELQPLAHEWYEAIVRGDRRRDDPNIPAEVTDDPLFNRQLDEVEQVFQVLGETARDQNEALFEADKLVTAPGEERIRSTVSSLPQSESGNHRRLRPWLVALVAVAATVLVMWALHRGTPHELEPGPWMGSGVEIVTPCGAVGEWAAVEWRGELPASGTYRVRLFDLTSGELSLSSKPLLEHRTTETRWELTRAETDSLSEHIWVELSVLVEGAATAVAVDSCSASR